MASSGFRDRVAIAVGLTAVSVLVAAMIGGALGFLASYPAVRLREDYLGMLLLADHRYVVAGEAPLARERPGVDVRPGAAEQVPVPKKNSQVRWKYSA